MNRKIIWVMMTIGSFIGGFIPSLWNASVFSLSGVFLTAVGGGLGIYVGYKMSE